jgi:hypothetical protein
VNSTPTTTANTTAKAIARRRFADDPHTTTSNGTDAERITFDQGRVRFKRDNTPRMLPGVVMVPVGPVVFELRRVVGPLMHPRGFQCNGLCYPDELLAVVDVNTPLGLRLFDVWHELGHAALSIYNPGQRKKHGEEAICDAIGAFMAGISPEKYSEIVRFIACEDEPAAA